MTLSDAKKKRKQNLRLALILACVAALFFTGFVTRSYFFGVTIKKHSQVLPQG